MSCWKPGALKATTTIHEIIRGVATADSSVGEIGGEINVDRYGIYHDQLANFGREWKFTHRIFVQNPNLERVCWYMFGDGTGGFTVNRVHDVEAANAFGLEIALALGDFLELDSRIVLDLDVAMPSIVRAVERLNT